MQVCTSLQTDNHASTPPLCFLQAGCPSCRPTNSVKALKALITQTTGKLFVFWMYWMIQSQSSCCIETLWTFTANIRLHSFMSLNVYFELLFAAEFLLTNVTRKPSSLCELQQMCLELIIPCKTVWTVSTWAVSTALYQYEYEHEPSVHCES